MAALAYQAQADTTRIPVDSVVLYRTQGMDDFELCHVLNVSEGEMDALFTHTVPLHTQVTITVGDESSPRQFHQLKGEVQHREARDGEWLCSISAAPDDRDWSSDFIYGVVCSNADNSKELVENYRSMRDDELKQLQPCASAASQARANAAALS